jgi:hypothetical protein
LAQLPEQTHKETSGGAMAKDATAREVRFYTKHDGRAFLHPASTDFSVGCFESPWLVYSEKVRTSKVRAVSSQKGQARACVDGVHLPLIHILVIREQIPRYMEAKADYWILNRRVCLEYKVRI